MIGAFLTDTMLRNDYSEARRLLQAWPEEHAEVVKLDVVFDNGRSFFAYEKPDGAAPFLALSQTFSYGTRTITLTLGVDGAEAQAALTALRNGLVGLTLLLLMISGAVLWFLLFRWLIRPMENEIMIQTQALRAAKENLEDQVRERTASLEKEIEIRKRAELAQRTLARAVEQNPIIVFITNRNGVIEYVNPRFEEVTGYAAAEAIGQTPRILKSSETPPNLHKELWETILKGEDWRHEIQDQCKDGSAFWADVHISPIRDDNGEITHFVSLHEDITERKLAEEATLMARRAAELSNKAKTELLANMSHELRTPLNAIIGFSDSMRGHIFGPLGAEQYDEYADFINASGRHLLDLINDILDVSAVEAGKLRLREEEVSIVKIFDATMQLSGARARDLHISLTHTEDDDLPLLYADSTRLKQIFINLVCNAVKFTPEGGDVHLNAYVEDDGSMVATVTDTGIGMDEEGIAKALEKFGQVDSSLSRKHEGTGLGLPLTKGLIELHGGTMELESAPNKGTKVIIRFPAERVIPVDPAPNTQNDRDRVAV